MSLLMMKLLLLMVLSVVLMITSSNLFMSWVALELKMFGMLPFLMWNKKEDKSKSMMFYFLVQVLGSIMFAWYCICGFNSLMAFGGLAMKMGISPFFWWVPKVYGSLNWKSMVIISTLQKMPPIILYLTFDLSEYLLMTFCLVGMLVSSMGMKLCSKKFKLLVAWSSMGKLSFMILLISYSVFAGMCFFLLYSASILLLKSDSDNVKMSSFGLYLLMSSGVPPLLGFMGKIFLFSEVNMWEFMVGSKMFMSEVFLKMGMWKFSMVMVLAIFLKFVGYIKVFMKLFFLSSSEYYNKSTMSLSALVVMVISLLGLSILLFG